MREPLVAILTFKRLFSRVDPLVLLQVMFEFESLATVTTFEFPQVRPVLVVGHVAHQLLQVGELLAAESAGLQRETWSERREELQARHCIAVYL